MTIWNRIMLLPMFVLSRVNTPPPQNHIHTYIPTFPKIHISPSFFRRGPGNPSYSTNTPNPVLVPPTPCFTVYCTPTFLLTRIFIIRPHLHPVFSCSFIWDYFYFLQCTVSTWSETKTNRLCTIFERIRGVPQQSGGSYSRKATTMKIENLYREIEIRLLLIA